MPAELRTRPLRRWTGRSVAGIAVSIQPLPPYLTSAAREIIGDASLPPRPHVLSPDDWSDLFHLPLSEEALGEFLSTSVS
jgi:hypothetical protein